jgi:large subunit ribosomal protein L10
VASVAKIDSVRSMKERLHGAHSALLTEYRGLSVRQISELRKQLKGASAEYRVLKNRLGRLAVKGSPLDPIGDHLKGPTGVAFTRHDAVAAAKALQTFARANPALTIKVGVVDGRLLQPEEIRALADLPSKEVLRAQVVGAIQGPLAQLVRLLTASHRELVHVLEARSKSVAE